MGRREDGRGNGDRKVSEGSKEEKKREIKEK